MVCVASICTLILGESELMEPFKFGRTAFEMVLRVSGTAADMGGVKAGASTSKETRR